MDVKRAEMAGTDEVWRWLYTLIYNLHNDRSSWTREVLRAVRSRRNYGWYGVVGFDCLELSLSSMKN